MSLRHFITMSCNVVLLLPDWLADISGGHCCSLSACLTPGETCLPLLASQRKPPPRNVQGEGFNVCIDVKNISRYLFCDCKQANLIYFSVFSGI